MDEFRENNRLRGALDVSLSGLNGDLYLTQRVLDRAEEQPKAVRKRSVGLVFALVALLAAVSVAAAAALNLGGALLGTEVARRAPIRGNRPADRHRLGDRIDSD